MKRCVRFIPGLLMSLLMVLMMPGCGSDGGGDATPSSIATVSGSAVKGPIEGAEIKLFYFDDSGAEVEIVAQNAPVLTEAMGGYEFIVDSQSLKMISSPLIARSVGGHMGVSPDEAIEPNAPSLEGIIVDPSLLTLEGNTVSCPLSTASSVAAGLLLRGVQETGFPPTVEVAQALNSLVETALGVELTGDPQDPAQGVAMVNDCVDQNLDLLLTPENNPTVTEYIAYLIANLSSSSGILDDTMEDPDNPGVDIPASFAPFGDGALAAIVGEDPSVFVNLRFVSDRDYIERDGIDSAVLTATLVDAMGKPVDGGEEILFDITPEPGQIYDISRIDTANHAKLTLISPTPGDIAVSAGYMLENGNIISQTIVLPVVDMMADTDNDGFADGEEELGWEIAIDEIGYGVEGALTFRHVTSDPTEEDSDGDGLDDFEEYLLRSDPNSPDTDGDGISDHQEHTRWLTSPTSVDTDGDARGPAFNMPPNSKLFDANELTYYRTSPSLADTDGDGRTDYEEVDNPARSPLIADLPKLDVRVADKVDVELSVEFAEEKGEVFQYGEEFSESDGWTEGSYKSHSAHASVTVGAGFEIGSEAEGSIFGPKAKVTGKITGHLDVTGGWEGTWGSSRDDTHNSTTSHSTYTTDSRTRTESAASGSLSMGIQLENSSDITYSLSQIGFTVRHWQPDPANPGQPGSFKTLATLQTPLGGNITLAPGETSAVLQVEATDVSAPRIKEFLKNPASLYIEPAYFEMENAEGLNFDFLREVTAQRTAQILIDFGDGRSEEYHVATNVAHNAEGSLDGITLGEILWGVLKIPYETRPLQEIVPDATTNESVLYSLRDTTNIKAEGDSSAEGFWTVMLTTDRNIASDIDFEDLIVKAGDVALLLFARDEDGDGLLGPEEQHYRTDEGTEDSDGDGLDDVDEIRGETYSDSDGNERPCGWVVQVQDHSSYPVWSNPIVADQDGDGWNDATEKARGTDPTLPDTDRDGLEDSSDPHPLIKGKILYVNHKAEGWGGSGTSWADAYKYLQQATSTAGLYNADEDSFNDIAEIWVATGVYTPVTPNDPMNQERYFNLVDNVGIYGGFSGNEEKRSQRDSDPLTNGTVLSGDLLGNDEPEFGFYDDGTYDDNSERLVLAYENSSTSILDGFMIASAKGSPARVAGGVVVTGGKPTLRNLYIYANRGLAGITASNTEGLTVSDCIFKQQWSNAIRIYRSMESRSYPADTVTGCEFKENSGTTIYGIYDYSVEGSQEFDLIIEDSLFEDNIDSDGAVVVFENNGYGRQHIKDSKFMTNETQGILVRGGKLLVSQGVFWNNNGAGLRFGPNTELHVFNSTFAQNSGCGLCYESAMTNYKGMVSNSIFWGNGEPQISQPWRDDQAVYGKMNVSYSYIQDSDIWGAGNISGDPKFVNPSSGNLRLGSDSDCIDMGENLVDVDPFNTGHQSLPATDLDGRPRIQDGDGVDGATIDMGAYEF